MNGRVEKKSKNVGVMSPSKQTINAADFTSLTVPSKLKSEKKKRSEAGKK
jgi:hypothetical protein